MLATARFSGKSAATPANNFFPVISALSEILMQRPSIAFSWPLALTLLAGCSQSTTPSGSPPATTEPVSSTPVTAPAATPGEGIIADHIRAMGGAEAVARIKTMHLTGQVSGSSGGFAFSGTIEETYDVAQDRVREVWLWSWV